MTIKKLYAGEYEVRGPKGLCRVERKEGGEWWVLYPVPSPWGEGEEWEWGNTYPTKRAALEAIGRP